MLISFEGYSDDIVSVDADGSGDEFGAHDNPKRFYVVAPDDTSIAVTAFYNGDGVWCFAPSMVGEDTPWPDWSVAVAQAHGYSMRLVVDAPEGSRVEKAED